MDSCVRATALTVLAIGATLTACDERADTPEPRSIDLAGGPAFPLEAHLESEDIAAGKYTFEELFEAGGDLFHTPYNGFDGVGIARLPDGTALARFSVPPTGNGGGGMVSSQSCGECHNFPHGAAAGLASSNRAGDPNADGHPPFVERATTSLWGDGIVQLLAQEMTEELQAVRDEVAEMAAGQPGSTVERALTAKGISYGAISASADANGEVMFDFSGVEGVSPDLVVRPMLWKGHVPTVRQVVVGAAAGLMGMQAEETVWFPPPDKEYDPDPDGDGVQRELSVGDITALTVYSAGQETPHSVEHLAELGMVAAPDAETLAAIERGRIVFASVGCTGCHVPEMHLRNTVFEEPTTRGNGHYYSPRLAERDAGYGPERPVRFDLLTDAEEPRIEPDPEGGAIVRLYGDLKRHNMGRRLADTPARQTVSIAAGGPLVIDGDTVLIPSSEFLTPELWGVGSTGPWLHDARAGTLAEAIMLHGEDEPPPVGDPGRSEAQESRDAFVSLPERDREAVVVFLRSLLTFAPRRGGS